MLYDKRWDRPEIKTDPFSLESLIAWLEKQPAGEAYCYLSNGECLLAQYFSDQGFENVRMWTNGFWHGADVCPGNVGMYEAQKMGRLTPMPDAFDQIASRDPATFDGALRRAKRALSRQSR